MEYNGTSQSTEQDIKHLITYTWLTYQAKYYYVYSDTKETMYKE